jgi:hypothetical protein
MARITIFDPVQSRIETVFAASIGLLKRWH